MERKPVTLRNTLISESSNICAFNSDLGNSDSISFFSSQFDQRRADVGKALAVDDGRPKAENALPPIVSVGQRRTGPLRD